LMMTAVNQRVEDDGGGRSRFIRAGPEHIKRHDGRWTEGLAGPGEGTPVIYIQYNIPKEE
jgi:hypothetical protein